MAKMFYSLEEAAGRLRKSPDQVRQMAAKGEITEFRDGDRLIFKVDQIDLLAGDEEHDISEMSSMIPLADTGSGPALGTLGLADSSAGSGMGSRSGEVTKGKSGIPVFDAEELELTDPAAVTQVTESAIGAGSGSGGLSVESLGSGSGLMDITRESDETSLGAQGLLDELYPSDEQTAGATATAQSSGLFEGSAVSSELASEGPGVMVGPVEYYDGAGSGLTGGLALGAVAALATAVAVVAMATSGALPEFFTSIGGENAPLIWSGIFAGATVLFTGVGFVLGKKSA